MGDTIPVAPPRDLRCLNCQQPVREEDAKMIFSVLVCSECHEVATIIDKRGRSTIRTMLTLWQETVRLALVTGKLRLPSGSSPKNPPSRRDVLRTIIQLVEAYDARGSAEEVKRTG